MALRRVDPNVEGSIYDLLGAAQLHAAAQYRGLLQRRRGGQGRRTGARGLRRPLVKLEVIGDDVTLLPDTTETLVAAEELVRGGFEVWAYTSDDLIVAQRLEQVGLRRRDAARLAHRLGSGHPQPSRHLADHRARSACRCCSTPGVGTASDAALAMELGCDGVLAASAMNRALEPVLMAEALRDAVRAGYLGPPGGANSDASARRSLLAVARPARSFCWYRASSNYTRVVHRDSLDKPRSGGTDK